MDVAALRSKVTFQKNETVTDKYGNHKNDWKVKWHLQRQ